MSGTRLCRWSESDVGLLLEANDVLAGAIDPEPTDDVAERHEKYLRYWDPRGEDQSSGVRMFAVLDGHDTVGGIGWWHLERQREPAIETGWFVLPRAENPQVAGAAMNLLLEDATRFTPPGRELYAFPSIEDASSNAVCAQNDFTLTGRHDIAFRDVDLPVNAWKHSLTSNPA